MIAVRPVGDWRLGRDPATGMPAPKRFHYVSPDGTTCIVAGADFTAGAMSWGVKSADLVRSFGLAAAAPGQPFYVTKRIGGDDMEGHARTGTGTSSSSRPFVQQGGEGIAVDAAGNVFVAAGQIFVYTPAGRLAGTIDVPERPTQIVFGGPDGRTLFIAARSSLYSVRTRTPGRRVAPGIRSGSVSM